MESLHTAHGCVKRKLTGSALFWLYGDGSVELAVSGCTDEETAAVRAAIDRWVLGRAAELIVAARSAA